MARATNYSVVHNNITLTAGAADTTSSVVDLSERPRGAGALIRFSNASTGPTVKAQTIIQGSFDQSNWYALTTVYGTTTNNDVTSASIAIDGWIPYIRFVSGSNTAQAVTLRIEVGQISID